MPIDKGSVIDGWLDASGAQCFPKRDAIIPLVCSETLRAAMASINLERINGGKSRSNICFIRLGGAYGERQTVPIY